MNKKIKDIISRVKKQSVSIFENHEKSKSILGEDKVYKVNAYIDIKSKYDVRVIINSESLPYPMLLGDKELQLNRELFVELSDGRVFPLVEPEGSMGEEGSFVLFKSGLYRDEDRYKKIEWKK